MLQQTTGMDLYSLSGDQFLNVSCWLQILHKSDIRLSNNEKNTTFYASILKETPLISGVSLVFFVSNAVNTDCTGIFVIILY